jgi:2-oxoglutarate dehydrogenase E1 component
VLPDPGAPDPASVTRLVFCSGKFGHELIARRDELGAPVAIVRLEQLYPWPETEILTELDRYATADVVWAQEEPGNMGARYFARRRIEELAGGRPVGVVARPASPSPASGSSAVHDAQQLALLEEAIPNP